MFDKLKPHIGHRGVIVCYGDQDSPSDITIECLDCNEVLISAETFAEVEKAMSNRWNAGAKELYTMYRAFIDSGFTHDQAFELVHGYIRQSTYEHLVNENKRARNAANREILRKRLRTSSDFQEDK